MSMTEKEVEELAAEVGEVDWTDPFYVDWLQSNLESAQDSEKQLKAACRFHKLMRDDGQMDTALRDLRRTRQAIETLESLLAKDSECDEPKLTS